MTDGTTPAEAEPKTFSLDYVRELREENKGLRLAKGNAERDRDGFKAAAEKSSTDARAEADRRIIRAELKAHAIRAGIVDLDALKLMDTGGLSLNEAGDVEGADLALARFKEAKPHFFAGAGSSTSSIAKPPPAKPAGGRKAGDMTKQEFATAMARIDRGLPPG
jgi:hypothetical protein